MIFEKYEGIGNDFIVADAKDDGEVSSEAAAKLCERRFGIGADGVILVLPPREPGHAARMRVINADGSVPEMCGNGLRCVALHVARSKPALADGRAHVFETDAGPRACNIALAPDGLGADVTVDMGIARVSAERRVAPAGETGEWGALELTPVDVGNPHAVAFRRPPAEELDRIGRLYATHPDFPQGANVGFALVRDRSFIDLVVWERGVGLTLACGTGACAAVAAACARDLCPWGEPVTVKLPGGPLTIWASGNGQTVRMRGPARHVFSGQAAVR